MSFTLLEKVPLFFLKQIQASLWPSLKKYIIAIPKAKLFIYIPDYLLFKPDAH